MKSHTARTLATTLLASAMLITLSGCRIGGNMFEVFGNAFTSIGALIVLIVNIVFMVEIVQSKRSTLSKVLWIGFIWIAPVLGALLYFFIGRDEE